MVVSNKTITLVMIVKNESSVIKRCLDSVKDYIDYWVICDTGSTDNTKEIIKDYFEKSDIPGELHEHEWKSFGHNRTLAVQAAKDKSDYSLLLDADFIFVPKDKDFKNKISADAYQIRYEGGLDYRQTLFVKSCHDWRYVGVTHEYIHCGKKVDIPYLDSFNINHKCDGGSRSDKFERDILLLKNGLKEEPDNSRYMFYLAQSYKDIRDYDNAVYWYNKRIEKGGWAEEVYYSMYMKGLCMKLRGDDFNIYKDVLLNAFRIKPNRLESLYELVHYCRTNDMGDLGFQLGLPAVNNSYPKGDVLFINKNIHDWMFFDELALCAYKINKIEISIQLYNKLIKNNIIPSFYKDQFNKNYNVFKNCLIQKYKKQNDEIKDLNKIAIIIVNNSINNFDKKVEKLKKIIKHPHDIIVVNNVVNNVVPNISNKSKYHSIAFNKNIGLTDGYLIGLNYSDILDKYFGYCFIDSSCDLEYIDFDIINDIYLKMKEDSSLVGVLDDGLINNMNSLINNYNKIYFSFYRAKWFNLKNRFNKELKDGYGLDTEMKYFAYRDNVKIIHNYVLNNNFMEKDINKDDKYKYFINKYGKSFDLFLSTFEKSVSNIKNIKKDLPKVSNKLIEEGLEKGLSFVIRAKNEENNIVKCLETLVEELIEIDNIEIIVVDNNSSDKTYELSDKFINNYNGNIKFKLYKYEKNVCKIGKNSKTEGVETISTYYNWCLEKVTKYNFIKWDADFIVHKDNLKNMIIENKLNVRDDNFALWFTGETLFKHKNEYLKKVFSYYDSHKGFSKRHCNKWKDCSICEYIDVKDISTKLRFEEPVFYEIFRTDIDEFSNKNILMDKRDKIDKSIYTELRRNSIFYLHHNKSELEKFKFPDTSFSDRKTYFFVYYGYHMKTGGTYVTLKTYVDYLLEKGDIVYVFERMPCNDEIKKLKPDCIISSQFANSDVNKVIDNWKIPHVVLTFAPNQYIFNGVKSKYPSLVTYSNSFIKSKDPLQKNGYVVRDPVNHRLYRVSKEEKEPKYITLIGSPPNVKGHNVFIKLAEEMPDTKFMLVSHEKEFKDKIFPENIKLQPYLKSIEELKDKVYSKTKVLLLPSIQEAFGRVTIEATSSDIPCIISNYPGLSEITYNMSNYVNKYEDVSEWKKELIRVLENYEDEVVKASKIREKLDFERDVKYFIELVEKAISDF